MKKTECFLDTSALIALNDVKDQYHKKAREIAATLKGSDLILSDSVINETYTLLRHRSGFSVASHFLESVMKNDEFRINEVTPSVRANTLRLLNKYSDHKISYCDALSMAMMKDLGIQRIFAFDHHFEIMGVELIRM